MTLTKTTTRFALALVPLLAAGAHAEITSISANASGTNLVFAEFASGDGTDTISRTNPFGETANPTNATNFESTNHWAFDDAIALEGGPQVHSSRDTVLNTDATGFSYNSTLEASGDLGSGIELEARSTIDSAVEVVFDTDTLVEVALRIDYARLMNTDISALISFSGLQDTGIDHIAVQFPGLDGYVEYTFQAMVLAGDTLRIVNTAQIRYDTAEHTGTSGSGQLDMSANIRVVPTPGTLGALSTLGLLATRRRR